MRILGITDRRRDELATPLTSLDGCARVVSVPETRTGLRKYVGLFRRVRQHLDHNPPEVLVSNQPGRLGFVVVVLGMWYHVPVVVKLGGDLWRTNHEKLAEHWADGQYLSLLARGGQIVLNQIVCSQAAGFLVVSEALKHTVLERTGRPKREVQVVHIPVAFERYANGDGAAARRRIGVEDDMLLLTVTNLNFHGKFEGIRRTIDELEPILEEHDVTYAIAGGGRYLDAVRKYVETMPHPIRKRIHLLGFVDDVADVYAAADVFVYLSNIDGYPNVILEAQAAGLPVVANAAHGLVEQIDDGHTGLLVGISNHGELRNAVRRLLKNSSTRRQLGYQAQQTVRERNSPETIGRHMLRAIKTIVER